jgi:undecaprenyl-diphosphatase
MSPLQAIVLGLIQGVTEFLPVSSSAHLILGSKLFGWPDQGLHFDMAVHSGSLVAMMIYLRLELGDLIAGLADLVRGRATVRRTAALQVAVATIPVGALGLALQSFLAGSGRDLELLGATSLVFGLLLWWADRRPVADLRPASWSWREIVWVGLAQALALFPGTSRSGVTMTAGLFAGMTRESATRLSFVLAVPVGLLVAAKDFWDLAGAPAAQQPLGMLGLGTVTAGISAYLAIRWLLHWVRRHGFAPFAIYRVALGLMLLGLATA